MATVKRHIIKGGGETLVSEWLNNTRQHAYLVTGLVCASADDDPLYEATSHPDIPKANDPHPKIPGLSVIRITADHWNSSLDKAIVIVTFGIPKSGGIINEQRIRFSATTALERVHVDLDGNQILVDFSGSTDLNVGGAAKMPGDVPALKAHGIIEYTWTSGTPVSLDYIGALNDGGWNGGERGQWVCRGADWEEDLSQSGRFRNTFAAEYDPLFWPKAAIWRDNATGTVPPGVAPVTATADTGTGNGWNRARTYEFMDFKKLNLREVY